MTDFSRKVRRPVQDGVNHIAPLIEGAYCREDNCERLDLHKPGSGCMRSQPGRSTRYDTRSKRYAAEPWRAHCFDALHECAFNAISYTTPRNFSMVLQIVENDYGTCISRSLHRHLKVLHEVERRIVRLDFTGRIHAYLRTGSPLVRDPDFVLEQIIDLHAERTGAVERAS